MNKAKKYTKKENICVLYTKKKKISIFVLRLKMIHKFSIGNVNFLTVINFSQSKRSLSSTVTLLVLTGFARMAIGLVVQENAEQVLLKNSSKCKMSSRSA